MSILGIMHNSRKRIFITGIAGFIGFHLARHLMNQGHFVTGCDNFNSYYDPLLKRARAKELAIPILECPLSDPRLEQAIQKEKITHIVHLAAQAGVRYSITHPEAYLSANIEGFFHILELVRRNPAIKLTYASSSSVYGLNKKIPFSETDVTDSPANFYAATKKSNELMAHSYHNLHGISVTGLRYFTVYGPWGRPDMAYFSFTRAIEEGKPLKLFNYGKMRRDFTYVDDIVKGTASAIDFEGKNEIFNLGNNKPEELFEMVSLIEKRLNKKAQIELLPMPIGEIETTYADIAKAQKLLGYSPTTSLASGMEKFLDWYQNNSVAMMQTC